MSEPRSSHPKTGLRGSSTEATRKVRRHFSGRRVWIVLGWAHSTRPAFAYSSTDRQRWHWTYKSALVELKEARERWTGTNWMIVRVVSR